MTFELDLDLEHTLDACWPGVHRVQVWWRSGHLSARRSDLRKSSDRQTDRRRTDDRRLAIALAHCWNELKITSACTSDISRQTSSYTVHPTAMSVQPTEGNGIMANRMVMWSWKVKVVTPKYLVPIISKTAGNKYSVTMEHIAFTRTTRMAL